MWNKPSESYINITVQEKEKNPNKCYGLRERGMDYMHENKYRYLSSLPICIKRLMVIGLAG